MIPNELGQQLHDKATRGAALAPHEQAQLQDWYAQMDSAEAQLLSGHSGDGAVATLRAQLSQALSQMTAAAQGIQELAASNDALRKETAALRERVARQRAPQPA